MISYILAIVTCLAVIGADQYTKYLVSSNYKIMDSFVLIPKLINFNYIENDGAAWGMLGGSTWLLLSLTLVVMLVCITLLFKYGSKDKFMFWSILLIIAGGIGNMIDRFFRGGLVIDFLQFDFWKSFPVFNVADCAIVIGGAMLVLYLAWGVVKEYKKRRTPQVKPADRDDENNENS